MSFLNPSDMVEEDAADLQFPKDSQHNEINLDNFQYLDTNNTFNISNNLFKNFDPDNDLCNLCQLIVKTPYIKCVDCLSIICTKCFANGKETLIHKSNHSYRIYHDNVELFYETNWSVADEKKLLQLLMSCGYGNWIDISRGFEYKFTPNECEKHYHNYYFGGIFEKKLGLTNDYYFPQRIPYFYKMDSIDPPRFNKIDDNNFINMSGYRSARGDFDKPYDKNAENLFNIIDMNNYDDNGDNEWTNNFGKFDDELKCSLFQAYNNRISERHRRYKIMRDHGLLLVNKTQGWLSKYSESLRSQFSNQTTPHFNSKSVSTNGRFVSFMQLINGIAFDKLVESLQYFAELKKFIHNLYEFRKNGITTMIGAKVYTRLKTKRLQDDRDLKMGLKMYDWRQMLSESNDRNHFLPISNNRITTQLRKKAAPIDIIGLAGYDKLTDDEKSLCSEIRLLPTSYLEYKINLITENLKLGCVRLADARRLIKIDVNKTRKLYDFLIEHGHLNKPNA